VTGIGKEQDARDQDRRHQEERRQEADVVSAIAIVLIGHAAQLGFP